MKRELKKFLILGVAAIMTAPIVCSCSDDDDDDNGGGGAMSGYVTGDGKTTNFKYGYVVYQEEDDWSGITLEISDTDLLYYYNHPSAVTDNQKVSTVYLDFDECRKGDTVSDDSFTDYSFECEIGLPLTGFMDDDDDYVMEVGYDMWNPSANPIKFHKTGNNFSTEANNITVKACYNSNGWNNSNSPDVKISFKFSGTPKDITGVVDDDYEYYSTRACGDIRWKVVTNPEEKAFLRKVHERIRSRRK